MAPLAYVLFSNMVDRILLCMMGLLVSCYSLHVEVQKEHNPSYRAACDFSESMSCSKVLTSKYARGFGIVERYLALLSPPSLSGPLLFYMSVSSVLVSFYLGYILFFVLRDVCVVCVTTYVINGLLLYLNNSLYTAAQ
ncbi:hypothetical protein BaRGS_00039461 [Batillaria attramentaria]|uniref:vitamin-K-epoxide reductase (warfarin-sensitive) n=1 Tax=Batillaria attramentaria TaxID=370345 RepID=A0ABD0J2Z5_9CAEN